MGKASDVQIFYEDNGIMREATPVTDINPIKQVVDVMKKVDLKSPDAQKNEVSIKDKNGKRIKLDDEPVRNTYFRGIEPSNNNTLKGVEQDKQK
ncbi:MAG: hypothetical protein UY49_C0017G0011 [Microgenomates group bacterium GW2011_GWC1_49_7]|nr:MAG: hypothetical protein UY49_C0017G0011 [Microgenomates group bacterium GW2011_GWC1_49_7]